LYVVPAVRELPLDGTPDAQAIFMRETPVVHKCTLHFRNGESVTGMIQSAGLTETAGVTYVGAVEQLPFRVEMADRLLLRILFRSFARELNARFEEEQIDTIEALPEEATEPEGPPAEFLRAHEA
jgi:hypothetical protein